MQLGTEAGLGPVDFVLDGDPAPLLTRSPAIAEGPRDAGVPVEIW